MGGGPRKVKAEFSQKKHVRGVLSMARSGNDVNSASSQFFIMHAEYPSLDGQYSAFGQVVTGMDAVDRIVNTPTGQQNRRGPQGDPARRRGRGAGRRGRGWKSPTEAKRSVAREDRPHRHPRAWRPLAP
jgi:cyclophilin family peptidyl-prolyl cis-trans isomerase